MKLILHIGTTKTGTTSIQTIVDINREVMSRNGFLFPVSLGKRNQESISVFCTKFDEHPDMHKSNGIRSEAAHSEWSHRLKLSFDRELAAHSNVHTVLISSEHLHSRCHSAYSHDRLHFFIGNHFSEIEIVCYLRPQIDHVVSLYSTLLKHGLRLELDEFIEKRQKTWTSPYFNFKTLLEVWSESFGAESIRVRLFDDAKKADGVVADFLGVTGLSDIDELTHPTNTNESISATGQRILLLRNRVAAPGTNFRRGSAQAVSEYIAKNFAGRSATPSLPVAESFQSVFREGNEWVRQTWFADRDAILEPDWTRYERQVVPGELPYELLEFLMAELFKARSKDSPPPPRKQSRFGSFAAKKASSWMRVFSSAGKQGPR
jgi:hypothetical protein